MTVISEVKKHAFEQVGDQLTTVQVVAMMEIVHPLLGWVKTGVAQPIMQVCALHYSIEHSVSSADCTISALCVCIHYDRSWEGIWSCLG